ncbi:MAG: molybdopterin converting factor subunit 1 [Bacteroidota bacterium]
MKITLLAFGITKDIFGQRQVELEVPDSLEVGSLLSHLGQSYPALKDLASLRVAVNEEYAQSDHKIQANDEIVLIPPVSGG